MLTLGSPLNRAPGDVLMATFRLQVSPPSVETENAQELGLVRESIQPTRIAPHPAAIITSACSLLPVSSLIRTLRPKTTDGAGPSELASEPERASDRSESSGPSTIRFESDAPSKSSPASLPPVAAPLAPAPPDPIAPPEPRLPSIPKPAAPPALAPGDP